MKNVGDNGNSIIIQLFSQIQKSWIFSEIWNSL